LHLNLRSSDNASVLPLKIGEYHEIASGLPLHRACDPCVGSRSGAYHQSYITTCRLQFSKIELIKPDRKFELTELEKILGADIMDENRVRPIPK
jgi:hypothetical protein